LQATREWGEEGMWAKKILWQKAKSSAAIRQKKFKERK
jgi:hypothetical protein